MKVFARTQPDLSKKKEKKKTATLLLALRTWPSPREQLRLPDNAAFEARTLGATTLVFLSC